MVINKCCPAVGTGNETTLRLHSGDHGMSHQVLGFIKVAQR